MLQWAVTLGMYDIQQAVMNMSRYRGMTRKEHLDNIKGILSYFSNFKDTSIESSIRTTMTILNMNMLVMNGSMSMEI